MIWHESQPYVHHQVGLAQTRCILNIIKRFTLEIKVKILNPLNSFDSTMMVLIAIDFKTLHSLAAVCQSHVGSQLDGLAASSTSIP